MILEIINKLNMIFLKIKIKSIQKHSKGPQDRAKLLASELIKAMSESGAEPFSPGYFSVSVDYHFNRDIVHGFVGIEDEIVLRVVRDIGEFFEIRTNVDKSLSNYFEIK